MIMLTHGVIASGRQFRYCYSHFPSSSSSFGSVLPQQHSLKARSAVSSKEAALWSDPKVFIQVLLPVLAVKVLQAVAKLAPLDF